MNLGNGTTKRERPRKAFESAKENYSRKLDFRQSSIPEGGVYRRRWTPEKNWFWITVKFLIIAFFIFLLFKVFTDKY